MHQDDSSKITAGYVDDFTATSNTINWKNGGMLCELGQKLGYYPYYPNLAKYVVNRLPPFKNLYDHTNRFLKG